MFSRGRINNKEKQASAGNWGHPRKFLKRNTKIDDPLIPEDKIKAHSKKKKKVKKEYHFPYHHCPFCDTELPLDEKKIKDEEKKCSPGLTIWNSMYRIKLCPQCSAKEVDECPACKNKTWLCNGVYKHQNWGCGFIGEKKK